MKIAFWFMILFLGACQSAKISTDMTSTKKNARPTLEDILMQKATKPSDIVQWLKNCSKVCLQPDAEIAGDLALGYQALFAMAEKNPIFDKLAEDDKKKANEAQKKIREAFVKIMKFKNGRDILQTALQELSNPASMYAAADTELDDLIQETIERLKNQPESRATGFYIQAISLPSMVENMKAIIEAYRQCYLVSGKADQQCLDFYNEVVTFYERPRCQNEQFHKGLRFVSSRELKKAILTNEDILESSLEVLGPDFSGKKRYELWFSLKTFSTDKLEKFTTDNMKKNIEFLLQWNGRTLAKANILQKIADGQFRMIFPSEVAARAAFDQICKKQMPDHLPENLKIK